jgi:hypothetical protein
MPGHILINSIVDETLPVRIVLRLADCSDTVLKHFLPRLDVKLDVFATDPAESLAENPTPTRDLIFSGLVSGEEDPLVVFNEFEFEGDEGSGNHVYLIWNIDAFLSEFVFQRLCQSRMANPNP